MDEGDAGSAVHAAEMDADGPPPLNVRRALQRLRRRWEAHSPASPFCLCDEVEPGVTFSQFCVDILVSQRSRRTTATASSSEHSALERAQRAQNDPCAIKPRLAHGDHHEVQAPLPVPLPEPEPVPTANVHRSVHARGVSTAL